MADVFKMNQHKNPIHFIQQLNGQNIFGQQFFNFHGALKIESLSATLAI